MSMENRCPQCDQLLTLVGNFSVCPTHGQVSPEKPVEPLRIFLSYGHDGNEVLVRRIKADLEARGHDVWFDQSEIKAGEDWRRKIWDGIQESHKVVSILSKHSTRNPGVCRDEIVIALSVKGGDIQTILVESEAEVQLPTNISHIQWLDMHDWKLGHGQVQGTKNEPVAGDTTWEVWYQAKFDEIAKVIESEESRRFAGEITKLSECLKPISSDARICQLLSKGFYGREWLFENVENWRLDTKNNSRLCWIMGDPGVGKSAFAAQLAYTRGDTVIAAQFCEWDKPDHRNAARVVRSLAFQLATRLPDYRKRLLTLPEIHKLDDKSPDDLFDYLLANPLRSVIHGGRHRYLAMIDALDEASEAGRNPLVEMLARNAARLPEWLGLVVTSRPEFDVKTPLQALNPIPLGTKSESNLADLRDYLNSQLKQQLENRPDADGLVEQILAKSEGVFLYVERFSNDVQQGHLSLDRPEQFPMGLGDVYLQWFQRQFPDLEEYEKTIEPVLGVILATREPIPINILHRMFFPREAILRKWLRLFGSLFPLSTEAEEEVVRSCHKSFVDWLIDHDKSGKYSVSIEDGRKLLADYCWQQYKDNSYEDSSFILKFLVEVLLRCGRWEDASQVVTNLFYLEARYKAGQLFDLILDFNSVRTSIPTSSPQRNVVIVLCEALLRDAKSIAQHNHDYFQALFQNLWNSCWWYDCPNLGWIDLNNSRPVTRLYPLLETWRSSREKRYPDYSWLRSLTPPQIRLGEVAYPSQNGYVQWVCNAEVTEDGEKIAYGRNDGSVLLRDETNTFRLSENGCSRPFREQTTHQEPATRPQTTLPDDGIVCCVSLSGDGKRVAALTSDTRLRVWNVDTGVELCNFGIPCFFGMDVQLSSSGFFLLYSSGCSVILADASTGTTIHCLSGHADLVKCVAMTGHGERIVSGSCDGTVRIWDAATAKESYCLTAHSSSVLSVDVSRDGRRIVSGADNGSLNVWNGSTGELVHNLCGHEGPVNCVAVSSDGSIVVSGGQDRTVRIWDANTGAQMTRLERFGSGLRSVAVSANGRRVISRALNGVIQVWNRESGEELQCIRPELSDNFICTFRFSKDGKRIIGGIGDGSLRQWETETGRELACSWGHESAVHEIIQVGDERRIISASRWSIRIWCSTGHELLAIRKYDGPIHCLSASLDGKVLVVGSDKLRADIHHRRRRLRSGHGEGVSVDQILDGDNDPVLCVIDGETGIEKRRLKGHLDRITAIAVSPDGGRIASGSKDGTWRVWNLFTGAELHCKQLSGKNYVAAISFMQDIGRIVTKTADGTTQEWNSTTGECLKEWSYNQDILVAPRNTVQCCWRVVNYQSGIGIESIVDDSVIGVLPYKLEQVSLHAERKVLAGIYGNRLQVLALEGVFGVAPIFNRTPDANAVVTGHTLEDSQMRHYLSSSADPQLIQRLAVAMHDVWNEVGIQEGWLLAEEIMAFEHIDSFLQELNANASSRMFGLLEIAHLGLSTGHADNNEQQRVSEHLETHLEFLANMEHEGWVEFHLARGWSLGPSKDRNKKWHPCLRPYSLLSDDDRDKDRLQVRLFPRFARHAGYKIIFK